MRGLVSALVMALALVSGSAMAQEIQSLRAQLVAVQKTVLSSQLSGQIAALPYREGARVAKGDVLIQLDCAIHEARLRKAGAEVLEARKIHQVNEDLDRLRSISALERAVSGARLDAALAEMGLTQVMVDRCAISAPFDGRVSEVEADPFQFVAEGEPVLSLIDDSAMLVEVVVPSRWLSWLEPGTLFILDVDETGNRHTARVQRIAPNVDPVSQSVKVYGALENHDFSLWSGMSGLATFQMPGG